MKNLFAPALVTLIALPAIAADQLPATQKTAPKITKLVSQPKTMKHAIHWLDVVAVHGIMAYVGAKTEKRFVVMDQSARHVLLWV